MLKLEMPEGFKKLDEKYDLANDQGLVFLANFLTPSGGILSAFEVTSRKVSEMMLADYKKITPNLLLKKKYNIKIGERVYHIYIVTADKDYFAQAYVDMNGGQVCFIASLSNPADKFDELKSQNPILNDFVTIMRGAK